MKRPNGFRGAVFDLDGLLIDSEPSWRAAQRTLLWEFGCDLTSEMQFQTVGLGLPAALAVWRTWFPGAELAIEEVNRRLPVLALDHFRRSGTAKPGAARLVASLKDSGCALAVASSSPLRFIEAALETLGLATSFHAIASAEREAQGKPHPAVYLTACRQLDIAPTDGIAFEDSLPGLRSAKAAGLFCVAVPEAHGAGTEAFAEADLVLGSLEDW